MGHIVSKSQSVQFDDLIVCLQFLPQFMILDFLLERSVASFSVSLAGAAAAVEASVASTVDELLSVVGCTLGTSQLRPVKPSGQMHR